MRTATLRDTRSYSAAAVSCPERRRRVRPRVLSPPRWILPDCSDRGAL